MKSKNSFIEYKIGGSLGDDQGHAQRDEKINEINRKELS